MAFDPDFSLFEVKVNAAGSWAKLGCFQADDYDRVKTACLILAETAKYGVKFKTVDAEGGPLEELSFKKNEGLQWREAKV